MGIAIFNTSEVRQCEIPSANAHASGRALAMVAAVIVEGGSLGPDGPRLLSEEGIRDAQRDTVYKRLNGAYPTWFGNAGFNDFKNERSGFVGWMGLRGVRYTVAPRSTGGGGLRNKLDGRYV